MPALASASIAGVRAIFWPFTPSASKRIWSVVMKRILRPMSAQILRGQNRQDRDVERVQSWRRRGPPDGADHAGQCRAGFAQHLRALDHRTAGRDHVLDDDDREAADVAALDGLAG